jgi:DNA-binding CsgD family transcriptional regulator
MQVMCPPEPHDESDDLETIERVAADLERSYAAAWDASLQTEVIQRTANDCAGRKRFEMLSNARTLDDVAQELWRRHPKAIALVDGNLHIEACTRRADKLLASYHVTRSVADRTTLSDARIAGMVRVGLESSDTTKPDLILERDGAPSLVVRAIKFGHPTTSHSLRGHHHDLVLLLLDPVGAQPTRRSATELAQALTRQERKILRQLLLGASVPEIASSLKRSPDTVKSHVRHIYAKVGVRSQRELIVRLSKARA